MKILVASCFFIALVTAQRVEAQEFLPPLQNPIAVPNPARAGEPVGIRFDYICPSGMGEFDISVQGNVVTIVNALDGICMTQPPLVVTLPIGAFPPGEYQVIYAPTTTWGLPYDVQTTQFSVLSAAAPQPVPAPGGYLLFMLAVVVLVTSRRYLTTH